MVAEENVRRTVKDIRQRSVIVRELEDAGDLKVLGAMYDMDTGEVELLAGTDRVHERCVEALDLGLRYDVECSHRWQRSERLEYGNEVFVELLNDEPNCPNPRSQLEQRGSPVLA
jgi:hypothetical protein